MRVASGRSSSTLARSFAQAALPVRAAVHPFALLWSFPAKTIPRMALSHGKLVRVVGLEPTRAKAQGILSPLA